MEQQYTGQMWSVEDEPVFLFQQWTIKIINLLPPRTPSLSFPTHNQWVTANSSVTILYLTDLHNTLHDQQKSYAYFLPVTSVQLSSESDSSGSNTWMPWACSLCSFASRSRLALSKSWISFSLVSLKIYTLERLNIGKFKPSRIYKHKMCTALFKAYRISCVFL